MTKLRGVEVTLSGNLLGDVLNMIASAIVSTHALNREAFFQNRESAAKFWADELLRYRKCSEKIYSKIRAEKRKPRKSQKG